MYVDDILFQIDFSRLTKVTSPNTKPEVVLRRRAVILKTDIRPSIEMCCVWLILQWFISLLFLCFVFLLLLPLMANKVVCVITLPRPAGAGVTWMKCGMLMRNDMTIAALYVSLGWALPTVVKQQFFCIYLACCRPWYGTHTHKTG